MAYSRASLEEVADKEKLDFSPKYDYDKKQYEFNDRDGVLYKGKPEDAIINGKKERVIRLTIRPEVQQGITGDKELSETVKASGKKTFAELNLNERMQMAMQMSYDKHYLPHDVQEALKEVNPRHLLAGVAVAGGVVYGASKAGAAKAIPYIGAGVTLAQITYYYGQADGFLQGCKNAKSPEELDEAAKNFATLIKQGGVDLTVTVATAGASKLGKVSKAGGAAVGVVEDGIKAAWSKIGKLNDEIVAGMRSTFGDDLVFETNAIKNTINEVDDVAKATVQESRAAKTLSTEGAAKIELPPAATPEGKAARWKLYQEKNANNQQAWDYERWSNVYEQNIVKANVANEAVKAYRDKIKWGEVEVTVEVNGNSRRLYIADKVGRRGIEHKTGYQSLNSDIKWELERDAELVKQGWKITWHFEGTASKQLVQALKDAKIKITGLTQ